MHKSRLSNIVIDCQTDDIDAAARFWASAIGRVAASEADPSETYRLLVGPPSEMKMLVQAVGHESRVHLDIETDDVEAEADRLERLGAWRVAKVKTWWVMEAPTGQRFCVVRPQRADFEEKANVWSSAFAQTPGIPSIDQRVAKGSFEVKLQALAFEGADAESKFGRLSIDKEVSGDLVATTQGQMLSAMTATQGSAGYVAIEKVTGTLHGKRGSFVLQHSSTMKRGAPSQSIIVVPDSGTDELTGLEGRFRIDISDGKHLYEFTYRLSARP